MVLKTEINICHSYPFFEIGEQLKKPIGTESASSKKLHIIHILTFWTLNCKIRSDNNKSRVPVPIRKKRAPYTDRE